MTTVATPALSTPNSSSHLNIESSIQDLTIHKLLGSAKFSVYLVQNNIDNRYYALKAYPDNENDESKHFKRESRFYQLSHPNICQIIASVPHKLLPYDPDCSFLVLEYAPYGDFYEFFNSGRGQLSEKLVRSYFHQLISGLEYLSQQGIAHLDIKCENLLIGANFQLKITDFDMAQYTSEKELIGNGSIGYRAPELIDDNCKDFSKADIYSAAIVLFILKSGGIQPHFEQENHQNINLYELLCTDKEKFWKIHESFQETENFYSESFRELFSMMTEKDLSKRATFDQIKKSTWYNGPVLSESQVKTEMRSLYIL